MINQKKQADNLTVRVIRIIIDAEDMTDEEKIKEIKYLVND